MREPLQVLGQETVEQYRRIARLGRMGFGYELINVREAYATEKKEVDEDVADELMRDYAAVLAFENFAKRMEEAAASAKGETGDGKPV